MKKSLKVLILVLLLVVLIGLAFIMAESLYHKNIGPIDENNTDNIIIDIPSGTTGYGILDILDSNGLISNINYGKIFLKLNHYDNLQAGNYCFNKSMGLKEIFDAISINDFNYIVKESFIVHEANRIPQVAAELEEQLGIPEEEFLELWKDRTYLNSLIDKYFWITDDILDDDIYYPLEGYLYPDTYYINGGATAEYITEVLLDQMDKVISERRSEIEKSGFTYHELLTLASIVQDESGSFDDMPNIAGVFINRLNIPMRLQSCSTCLYGIQQRHINVTFAEMDKYTPYNTYAKDGLPVGPICQFSYHAIDGVLNYTHSDYLYFFACEDRTVLYARTLEEHERNANENAWF